MAPTMARARFHLGMLLADGGRPHEGRVELEWVVATLPPDDAMAIDAKARLDRLDEAALGPTPSAPPRPAATSAPAMADYSMVYAVLLASLCAWCLRGGCS
jgi:hypothetical protein